MKNIFVTLAALFMLINTPGCASINENMASWMGHNSNELIASWGPPQQIMPDGQEGQILIYSQARQWTTPGRATTNTYGSATTHGNLYGNTYQGNTYGNATSTTSYTPAQTYGYSSYRMFWADKNGNLYRWSWKGL